MSEWRGMVRKVASKRRAATTITNGSGGTNISLKYLANEILKLKGEIAELILLDDRESAAVSPYDISAEEYMELGRHVRL